MSARRLEKQPLPAAIEVNGVPIQWNAENNGFTFFGLPAVLFWVKPSLVSLFQPLQEELGEDLFSKLIAFEVSKGTFEDYHSMVGAMGQNFVDGFHKWGSAVSAAGWGQFEVSEIDWQQKTATIFVTDSFETSLFKTRLLSNMAPFTTGKIAGIFGHAFKSSCRAEVIRVDELDKGSRRLVFSVVADAKTLEEALMDLKSGAQVSELTRLRAENNSLRRNQSRLLGMLATVGEFIWESDPHLSIVYATEQASAALGVNAFTNWKTLLDGAEYERLLRLLVRLDVSNIVEGEFRMAGESGRCVHLRIKRLTDFNNNHIGYVGSGRDVTAEKDLKHKLHDQQKNAEYAAKMATLGEMAGGVAHEINTPLAVISLLSERISLGLEVGTPLSNDAEKIIATTERIASIIQGLKAFARDARNDQLQPTSVRKLVDDTLSLCQSRFNANGIQFEVLPLPEKLQIPCRATQVSQVLLNLLNNSYDAVMAQEMRWIRIEVREESSMVIFRIIDSGRGIPEALQKKVMEPFFTTKEVGKGTGLGLSISQGIVESHGGKLEYDSQAPHTTFTVRLPK